MNAYVSGESINDVNIIHDASRQRLPSAMHKMQHSTDSDVSICYELLQQKLGDSLENKICLNPY